MSQNFNTTINNWTSSETAANAYSRFVSTVADNTVTALRNTNNFIFSSLDAWRSTLQQARDNSKQIFHLNTKTAKTFEQNARELTRAAQHAVSRYGGNTNTSFTATTPAGSASSTTSTLKLIDIGFLPLFCLHLIISRIHLKAHLSKRARRA